METVLSVHNLARRFGDVVAVDGVSFAVDAGETYGLLGPNGAGKTTTISMVCGVLASDAGEVEVAGRPMTTGAVAAKELLGLVPQDVAVYPELTARENLVFFGRLAGLGRARLAARVGEVLATIGLSDRADDRVKELSGGMRRRLNIGIGLLNEPRLLVLDEPTVGVDPQSRHAILESVAALAAEGMAVLYTTHYMEEAERLCDRVGIIDGGRIVAEGTRRELVSLVGERSRLRLTAAGPLGAAAAACGTVEGVESASERDGGIDVVAADAVAVLPSLFATVAAAGAEVTGLDVVEPDLEAVFLHLTGKALRD